MTANAVEIRSLVVLAGGSEIPVNEHEDSILAYVREHDANAFLPLVEVLGLGRVAPAYVRCGSIIAIRPYVEPVRVPRAHAALEVITP